MPNPTDPVLLAATYAEQLTRTGQVIASFDTDAERDLRRQAGRAAGRLLDRPVQTLVEGKKVLIVLTDWLDNLLQAQVEDIRARKAIDQAFAAPDTPPAPPSPPVLKVVPPPSNDAS